MRPIFTVSKMELFHCTDTKLLLKGNYLLFPIMVFIVEVVTFVEFNQYNTSSKIPTSTVMHFATGVKTWCVSRLSAYWLSFMLAITSITSSSNLLRVSTFFCALHSSSNHINKNLKVSSMEWVKDNFWRQIQTAVQINGSLSETVRNRTRVHIQCGI